MSNIIDHTYFYGKLSLPQTNNTEGRSIVDQFITTYEPEYLQKALGYDLWKAFTTGIEGSGEPDQRWKDLLEGKEITYQNRTYKWTGFENTEKKSPIACYVYYKYMEDKASDNTLVGTVVQNVDNNTRVNSLRKMVDAWNSMVDMNNTLWLFLYQNKADYPEWKEYQTGIIGWANPFRCHGEVFNKINEFGI
jgi:hypothetical protein